MTVFEFLAFCASTFLSWWSSTNGPFFRLRGICRYSLAALPGGVAPADDETVTRLALAPRAALGLALRVDRVATTGGLTLTTTVRVVDRVHRDTADGRALALPPHAAGLAPVDVRLIGVADLADGRAAVHADAADLARGHAQRGVLTLAAEELDADAGRAGQLGTAAGPQLDAVDRGTDRNVAQRKVAARLDVRARTRLHPIALLEVLRADDVALLAVGVVQRRDPGS